MNLRHYFTHPVLLFASSLGISMIEIRNRTRSNFLHLADGGSESCETVDNKSTGVGLSQFPREHEGQKHVHSLIVTKKFQSWTVKLTVSDFAREMRNSY